MENHKSIDPKGKIAKVLQFPGHRERNATTPIRLPLRPLREAIRDAYLDGRSELEIAANLKLPVGTVRITLWAMAQIERRYRAIVNNGLPAWMRQQYQEVEQEVLSELQDGVPPGGASMMIRRAA